KRVAGGAGGDAAAAAALQSGGARPSPCAAALGPSVAKPCPRDAGLQRPMGERGTWLVPRVGSHAASRYCALALQLYADLSGARCALAAGDRGSDIVPKLP